MPFNQLPLPLISGYLFVTFITSYWACRQGKQQVPMAPALVGILALAAARVLAVLLMATAWGREAGRRCIWSRRTPASVPPCSPS
ncbi:hypothetical protein [Xanthomonas theicola]|uniref:Uncharacterized protein n=1 Tax=Xanthomonas theicola TaxID=56464 RepID=A0A2S6ZEV3_9XANT|nr:hypothetical protein [Xanthomonas theicola]PPT90753.1 hypothetical protein XthCFBP4691_10900 [Xanthomonas theicola]QNH23560.1 hypothetical protein G4Q83_00455 [Xanthomonas theicola]